MKSRCPRILCLVVLLGLIPSAVSAGEPPFFPLLAWNRAPNDPAVLRKMAECGLTVAGFVSLDGLDACQAAGLQAIVSDPRVSGYDWLNVDAGAARTNVASLVAAIGRHPAVFGYYLIDEPGTRLFPGLAKVASLVQELAPGKWAYINLFPNYASMPQLGTFSYTNYLELGGGWGRPAPIGVGLRPSGDDFALRSGACALRSCHDSQQCPMAPGSVPGVPSENV